MPSSLRNPIIDIPDREIMVDCSSNPYDVRPAVKAIADRVSEVSVALKAAGSSQKIVVLMGEAHNIPSHQMLQAALIKTMVARQHQFVFGEEHSHNYLTVALNEAGALLTPDQVEKLLEHDHYGHRVLKVVLGFSDLENSKASTFLTILDENIPFAFTDTARKIVEGMNDNKKNIFLDASDRLTAKFIKAAERDVNDKINAQSTIGMSIRNSIMVDRMLAAMERQSATIGIQQCGRNHVFGHKGNNYYNAASYEGSLVSHFKKADIISIPVFISTSDGLIGNLATVPLDAIADKAFRNMIHVWGLRREVFEYGDGSDELGHMAQISEASHLSLPILTENRGDTLREEVNSNAISWIQAAKEPDPTHELLGNQHPTLTP